MGLIRVVDKKVTKESQNKSVLFQYPKNVIQVVKAERIAYFLSFQ